MTTTGARRPSDATSAEQLLDRLTAVVSPHVKVPPTGLDPAVPLAEYGLDSVTAIALAAEVEDELGVVLADDALWEHPTLDELAALLERELSGPASD
ncbi:acyl carrier protein [Saccharothrix xinjiangensis]|uniref:Acyl carrier protein n=1 Tax=Saccharothrix xinjiangensis TaxID=204798 RepID=A0ABV9XZ47_9PSEU